MELAASVKLRNISTEHSAILRVKDSGTSRCLSQTSWPDSIFALTIRVCGILVFTYNTAPFCKRISTRGELKSAGGLLMNET